MTPSPPYKRARTSSPTIVTADSPSSHILPLATRSDLAMLSKESCVDLILALISAHPTTFPIVDKHLHEANLSHKSAAQLALSVAPLNFDHILAKVKPRLERFKLRRVGNDEVAVGIRKDIIDGIAEMSLGCDQSDAEETRRSALDTMAVLAKLVVESRNQDIKGHATSIGKLLAEAMCNVLDKVSDKVEHMAEMLVLKEALNEQALELEDLYLYNNSTYQYSFADIDAIFSWY